MEGVAQGRAKARTPQTETGPPMGGSTRAQGGARDELLPIPGLVGRAWLLSWGSSVGSRGMWSPRTLGSPGSRSGDTEGRGSVQRSQRKQATRPALPSGFLCLHGLRGCLAAPHPLSSLGPSACPSMVTGTLPCLALAWSPLPCASSASAPPEQKPCLGPGLSLAILPALTALQASTVPGAGSQARPSPSCSLSWAPLPTQGSLKAEGCGGRRAASQLRAGTPTSGSVLATTDGRQWGAAGRAGLPPSAGRRLVMGGGGFLLWLSRGLRLSCSPSGGWTRGRGVGSF